MRTIQFHIILTYILLLSLPTWGQKQWYFTIEERHPAEYKYLQDKQRILVVNNAIIQPKEFGHSTIIDGETKNLIEVDLNNSILFTLLSTVNTMDQSGEFDVVEPMDIPQNKSTNFYSRTILDYNKSERLCSDYQADALLILNQIVLYDVLETFLTEEDKFFTYLQAYAQSHWTIHYAGQNKDTHFTIADTLLWESQLNYSRTQSINELPPRQESLLYLAQELGTKVGKLFIPSWKSARRYFYETEQLKDGINAFQYQRWEDAIELWTPTINNSDKKTAACAAANIAIAYEMLGDYDEAFVYAQKAYRLFGVLKTAYARQQQVNIRYYQELLREKQAREDDL